jgi:RNA binding chromodomain-containing protein
MVSRFRFAGIITVIFAVCGPARAQELAPAGSGVTIDKLVVENGLAHTVKYYVKGGSPRLQALVRRVEWTENELSVIEQLQLLKLDTVVNERRVAAFRTAQLTNPDYPPGFIPLSIATDNGGDGASSLQRALKRQLAYEATPDAALQLIGFLEQMQTQLDAELKALPPQEKKAAQGPIDALRPRVAALPRCDVPPPRPQPVVPRQVRFPAQAVPQQLPMPLDPVAFQQRVRQNQAEVEWQGTWWAAEVVKTNGDRYYIHYTGWDNSWDEWVGPDRLRMPVAKQ